MRPGVGVGRIRSQGAVSRRRTPTPCGRYSKMGGPSRICGSRHPEITDSQTDTSPRNQKVFLQILFDGVRVSATNWLPASRDGKTPADMGVGMTAERCATCFDLAPCRRHNPRKAWVRTTPRRQPGGSGWQWSRIRLSVLTRDGHRCRLRLDGCTGHAEQVDHLLNVARGGSDDASNLVSACKSCHRTKTAAEAKAGRQ